MSAKIKNKNVRLSYQAWKNLRNLKFDTGKQSYTDVFEEIFNVLENKKTDIENVIVSKKPDDKGTNDISKSDKTIVIDSDIHRRLAHYKIMYMRENDATARGPGAVSISQIVVTLIEKYRELLE